MKRRNLWCAGLALLACTAPAARAASGTLAGWGGTGEVGVRAETSEGRSTARPFVRETAMRGWLSGSVAGQLPEGRWLTWNWTARPSFVRSGGNASGADLSTDAFAHQFVASTQPRHWVRAQFSADRDRVLADRGGDASRESRTRRTEGRFELRPGFAALGASARDEWSDDRWVSTALAPELQRELRRRTSEAWLESSRTRFMHREVREQVAATRDDVRTRWTTFDHALPWGHGSRLATRLEWAGQTPGGATIVDRRIHEQLHVRHTSWLASDYRFEHTHAALLAGEARTSSHQFELGGRVDGKGWALAGGLRRDESPGREGRAWNVGPRASWQRAWAGGLRMSVQGGAALEHERRTGARDAVVAVPDEAHTIPASRTFALDVEGADSATVVLRDAYRASGYVEGVDYTLLRTGLDLQVIVPFGGRLAPGDRVRVSYEATPPGTPGRRAVRSDAAWTADWRGFSLRAEDRRTRATDSPVDRGAARLGSREELAQASASLPRGPARLDLAASARWRALSGVEARHREGSAGLAWRLSGSAQLFADATLTDGREGGLRLRSSVQRLRTEWNAGGRFRWSARLERTRFTRAGAEAVTHRGAGLDGTARLGLLEATARAEAGVRDGSPGHDYRRASLTLVRRFR
ncbi:MAG: hypothetical protein HZA61_11155 [Candidatus Eisenbacteria bacterium]|uniref:TIGR03016 family PEP-CTERM system-associated outer membrane protein n=1 Tax=Eiseniibacteriota bacterium TaxID=2212470 RepID=A0A933W8Z4_UNCEI|nr:hypothetical protein [Candidatus Eisenbacteria bacterium]